VGMDGWIRVGAEGPLPPRPPPLRPLPPGPVHSRCSLASFVAASYSLPDRSPARPIPRAQGIDGAENLPHQFPVAMYPVVGQQHGEIAGVMPSTCRPGLKAAIQQGYHVPVVRYPSSRAEG